ncbi:N-acetyl-galactosamine [Psychromonas sp. CNPT3]|uniref:PTS galactosamine/N-acetylgalactosamine transporter subunit IIA n=1 Tax=Psychromonas sp. CNPT3 TaxID=314282 RepID=UPI00006E7105|nr:PTS galactosamine/N-acetylgalactosamine transporter subunit IIA [Psychromonas sp. CNPT3]AGH82314.1 N-acetyl-galactosamine [Psychromonas sp. CNPT3]
MLGVIISGHGGFASGMEKAMLQIVGLQDQVQAIDFPEESTSELLESQFKKAFAKVDSGDGVIFLTDLLGGTPFRTASMIALEKEKVEVITGCNLQMILESLLERDELTISDFKEFSLASGHRGMTSLKDELQKSKEPQKEDEDGI